MNKRELTLNVKITEIDKVKNLITLLADRMSELPRDLAISIKELVDGAEFEMDADYFRSIGANPQDLDIYIDKGKVKDVISINKHLKTAKTASKGVVSFGYCEITHKGILYMTIGEDK